MQDETRKRSRLMHSAASFYCVDCGEVASSYNRSLSTIGVGPMYGSNAARC
jgi:hypothetical protein